MARDHPLAAKNAVRPKDLVADPFVKPSNVAPALIAAIDAYAAKSGIRLGKPTHEVDDLAMAVALIASTRAPRRPGA